MNKVKNSQSVVPYNGDKLTKYNPSRFDIFHDEWDNWFDSFAGRLFSNVWADPTFLTQRNYRAYDVQEDDKQYIIEVELPRFKRNQIKLQIVNGAIQLIAENEKGTYSKTWSLSNVNLEKITSKLEDGVLHITIEKTPESQPKLIDIQ